MKSKIMNYHPLPTNRKKRSKLFKIQKSNALINQHQNYEEVNLNSDMNKKKNKMKKILLEKQLINN